MPSREYYLKDDDTQYKDAYLKYMTNIAILLGADKDRATRDMAEVLEFEVKLAEVSFTLYICVS